MGVLFGQLVNIFCLIILWLKGVNLNGSWCVRLEIKEAWNDTFEGREHMRCEVKVWVVSAGLKGRL